MREARSGAVLGVAVLLLGRLRNVLQRAALRRARGGPFAVHRPAGEGKVLLLVFALRLTQQLL